MRNRRLKKSDRQRVWGHPRTRRLRRGTSQEPRTATLEAPRPAALGADRELGLKPRSQWSPDALGSRFFWGPRARRGRPEAKSGPETSRGSLTTRGGRGLGVKSRPPDPYRGAFGPGVRGGSSRGHDDALWRPNKKLETPNAFSSPGRLEEVLNIYQTSTTSLPTSIYSTPPALTLNLSSKT